MIRYEQSPPTTHPLTWILHSYNISSCKVNYCKQIHIVLHSFVSHNFWPSEACLLKLNKLCMFTKYTMLRVNVNDCIINENCMCHNQTQTNSSPMCFLSCPKYNACPKILLFWRGKHWYFHACPKFTLYMSFSKI